MKIITWDLGRTEAEIVKRYKQASDSRASLEDRWSRNERAIYSHSGASNLADIQTNLESAFNVGFAGVDQSNVDVNMAYTFKNFRMIHAQMSANPPAVAMRPTSSDQDDHRKADAADRVARWALRHYKLQEKADQQNLHCLLYGSGFLKTVWDSTRGDIIEYNEQTEEVKLEGDIEVSVPFTWNIFLDPDAKSWDEVKYVFERVYMDYDEACQRWPDKLDILKQAKLEESNRNVRGKDSNLGDQHYNVVELLEYWETGLPTNGYLGRYCVTTIGGKVIEPCRPSPFRFKKAGAVSRIELRDDIPDEVKERLIEKLPEQASLPYHLITDIDIPNMPWGKSFVEYAAPLQENLNRIDTAVLDNIQANGVARMILPEATEISDDSLSNSPWDVVKITGNQPPYFMSPPQLMPEMTNTRELHRQAIDEVCGVNEAMFGQQSREQSGASMQYATNQGNMIRRRLFNKYTLNVESIYKAILNLVRKHWTIERTIHVLGKEKALEAVDLKGADIDGGYDVVGEYGITLSLDPITRREEILTMQPLFEKAGVPPRKMLELLKLNELEGAFDRLALAGARQKEIFDYMIATQTYVAPKKYRDHENMIAWAMDYFMSAEFESLPEEIQQLCEQHIEERGQLAAQESAPPAAPAGTAPQAGPAPMAPVTGPGVPPGV